VPESRTEEVSTSDRGADVLPRRRRPGEVRPERASLARRGMPCGEGLPVARSAPRSLEHFSAGNRSFRARLAVAGSTNTPTAERRLRIRAGVTRLTRHHPSWPLVLRRGQVSNSGPNQRTISVIRTRADSSRLPGGTSRFHLRWGLRHGMNRRSH